MSNEDTKAVEEADAEKGRRELLLRMYDQMFSDINRHIVVTWQAVGALVGSLAVFALAEKQVITVDWASALVVLIAVWVIAHMYDSSYWYNRNLVIIANIERLFLVKEDLHRVHYYFGAHRSGHKMLTHLRIQWWLGVGIAAFILLFHFFTRVFPGIGASWHSFEVGRVVPYVFGAAGSWLILNIRKKRLKSYEEFLKNSPGISVNTNGISFGVGHPAASCSQSQRANTTERREGH